MKRIALFMTRKLKPLMCIPSILIFAQLCVKAQVPIEWQNKIGCIANENTISKTLSGNSYNSGASSANVLPSGEDGWAEFTIMQLGQKLAFGFSQLDSNTNINSIDYAIETATNEKLKIYASGSLKGTFGNYKIGDKIKIERNGLKLNFYNNRILLKTFILSYNTTPYLVDVSLGSQASSLNDARASFIKPLTINPVIQNVNSITGELGSVTLNISGGKLPYNITWISPNNERTELTNQLISNLEIGTYTAKISDGTGSIINRDFTILNKLNWIDSLGVIETDSSLIKLSELDSWTDAGAYSLQDLKENESGFIIHKITSIKYRYAIGIHNTGLPKTGYHYSEMEYSFVIINKKLCIYKKDHLKLRLSTDLIIGDEIKINKTGTNLIFYHNNIELLIEPLPISYGICAQVSLFKANMELKNISTTFMRPVRIFYNQQDVNCIKEQKGSITVNPTGGVGPYRYQLNNDIASRTNFFSNLDARTYTIKVIDRTNRTAEVYVSILNCPVWDESFIGATVNTNGDITRIMEGNSWGRVNLKTTEPFVFAKTPNWISFKTSDTLSVYMLGFRSIELDSTAQTTNYKLLIENSVATVIETDNDGFYNKRQIKRISKDMGFKVQLTQEGIEYYVRDNSTLPYVLIYTSKLFSTATLIIEATIYKSGSKIEAVRQSNYGNAPYPSAE